MNKKSQGEIFGIMIFFVLLVIGFLLYSEFRIAYSSQEQDVILESEFKILVDSTMQVLKNSQTECFNNDALSNIELLDLCVDNTGISTISYDLSCNARPYDIEVCQTLVNNLNSTLTALFTGESGSSPMHSRKPYVFRILPSNDLKYNHLNVTLTNIDNFSLSLDSADENYYLKQGYSRISSDFENIPTNQGKFEFELSFFHKR